MATNLPDAPLHLPTDHPAWLDWFVTIRSMVQDSSDTANVAVGFADASGAGVTSSYYELVSIPVTVVTGFDNTTLVGFVSMKVHQAFTGAFTAKATLNGGGAIERGFTSFQGVGDLVFPFVYTPGAGSHSIELSAKSTAQNGANVSIPSILVMRFAAR